MSKSSSEGSVSIEPENDLCWCLILKFKLKQYEFIMWNAWLVSQKFL